MTVSAAEGALLIDLAVDTSAVMAVLLLLDGWVLAAQLGDHRGDQWELGLAPEVA